MACQTGPTQICKQSLEGILSSLFQNLTECTADAEVEWQLFKAPVASSAARVYGRKRLGVANNGKKVTPWFNQEVKDGVQKKEVACKTWLPIKPHFNDILKNLCIRGTIKCESPHLLRSNRAKWNLARISDYIYIPVNSRSAKSSGRLPGVFAAMIWCS